MPTVELEDEGPDWRLAMERRGNEWVILENQPPKQAVYTTTKRPAAHLGDI